MSFKEWWKSKPYWLKGALFGLILCVIFGILLFVVNIILSSEDTTAFLTPLIVPFIPTLFLLEIMGVINVGIISDMVLMFIISLVEYSAIGALIGWIVGKIKSKKK
ncbi:MAG: hypothetical protein WC852_01160 [Candidatus Nanoarchaeia archaeon]|jgi:glycopeptide antibiotics resistance protein